MRAAAALFGALALLLLSVQAGWDATEGAAAVPLERAMARGSLSLPTRPFSPWFRGAGGRYWLPQEHLAPALAAPLVALGDALPPPPGLPPDTWANALEASLGAVVSAATGAVLFLLMAGRLGVAPRTALAASALAVLGSTLLPYARTNYDGQLSGLFLLAALLPGLAPSRRGAAGAGALLGFAVLARFSSAAPALPLALLAAAQGRGKERVVRLGLVAAAALPAVTVVLALNAMRTGSPIRFPAALPEFASNNALTGSFWSGFFGNLASPGKGLLFFAPLCAIGPMGLWARSRPIFTAALAALLALAAVHAPVRNWSGHWGWGPRYLVPAVPLLLLGLGPALDGTRPLLRAVAWGVAVPSFLVQLPAVLANWTVRTGATGAGDPAVAWDPARSQIADHVLAIARAVSGGPCAPRDWISWVESARCTPDLWWLTWSRAGAGGWTLAAAALLLAGSAGLGRVAWRSAGPRGAEVA